jgi:hypothetical protein
MGLQRRFLDLTVLPALFLLILVLAISGGLAMAATDGTATASSA